MERRTGIIVSEACRAFLLNLDAFNFSLTALHCTPPRQLTAETNRPVTVAILYYSPRCCREENG
jgi:hypothetical protein